MKSLARLVTAIPLIIAAGAFPALAQELEPFSETITVTRYLINVRALDTSGRAITDLTAGDFSASIGGRPAVVESATWIGAGGEEFLRAETSPAAEEGPSVEAGVRKPDEGRMLVVFVQTDFGRANARLTQHVKFNAFYADAIVGMLQPGDQVAVLSFDSHLKLRSDFTQDHEVIRNAVKDSIRIEMVPLPEPPETGPSLARHLESSAMRRVTSADAALLMIGRALRAIDGHKVLVLAAWGMGSRLGSAGSVTVILSRDWYAAIDTLRRDHVPVISISHGAPGGELSLGLRRAAASTGGIYVSVSDDFTQQILTRIEGALTGHYELGLRVDQHLEAGRHGLRVEARKGRVRIVAQPFIDVAGHQLPGH